MSLGASQYAALETIAMPWSTSTGFRESVLLRLFSPLSWISGTSLLFRTFCLFWQE